MQIEHVTREEEYPPVIIDENHPKEWHQKRLVPIQQYKLVSTTLDNLDSLCYTGVKTEHRELQKFATKEWITAKRVTYFYDTYSFTKELGYWKIYVSYEWSEWKP